MFSPDRASSGNESNPCFCFCFWLIKRLRTVSTRALIPALLFLTTIGALIISFPGSANAEAQSKRVLILSSYDLNRPAIIPFIQSLRSTIVNNSRSHVEFFYEFQNSHIADAHENALVSFLKEKYGRQEFDLVIALGAPAINILLRHESEVLTNTPKIFYLHDETENTAQGFWPRATGVWATLDIDKTAQLALNLHPDAQNLLVITGSSNEDQFLRQQAQAALKKYENKLQITYLDNISMNELKAKVASLPPHTIVIFLAFFLDSAGNSYASPEALSLFAPNSAAPVYGISNTHLGRGIVGGSLIDSEALGRLTGELSHRILEGEKVSDIRPQTLPNVASFDWRQIKRWQIDERRLPPGANVQFRTLTFWEQYKSYVLAAFTVLLIQMLLIIGLLYTQRRRKQAETERQKLSEVAAKDHRRLGEIISNVPGLVWETITDPKTNQRRTTYISDYVQTMLGYTPAEWLAAPPGFGLRIMAEEDRDRVARESEAVVTSGKEGMSHFRWRTKDGRTIWAESYHSPMVDSDNKVIGLRGITIDITERKRTEEILRQTEEKDRAILEAVPDLMFLHTRDGVFLDYHCKDSRDLFVPPEKFLGKNVRDIMPSSVAEKVMAGLERAEEGPEPYVFEYELPLNGHTRWFEGRMVANGENVLTVIRDITQRIFIEEAVKRNEAQLSGIINSAMDAIISVDEDERIVVFNAAAETVFGCRASDAIGRSLEQFIPERFREAHRGYIRNFGEQKVTSSLVGTSSELYGLRTSGEEFPMEASISQIELHGQKLYTIILRDITDRKVAEGALKESELNYRSIFNAANDAIFVHDLKTGAVIDVNHRMCEMYGCTVEEARKLTVGDLSSNLTPYTNKEAEELVRNAASGKPQLFEWHAKKVTGELFWVEVSLRRVSISGEACVLALVRDVTDRKRSLDELRESEERFGKAFRSNPQPMSITTLADGVYLDVNDSFLAMSGYTGQDVIGHSSLALGIWTNRTKRDEFMGQLVEKGSLSNVETIFCTKNGSQRILLSSAERVEIAGQDCVLVSSSDITERMAAQQALRDSEARYRQMAEAAAQANEELMVAHEEVRRLKDQLEEENIYLQEEVRLAKNLGEMIGDSDAIKYVMFKVSHVAITDSTVLITGETGTGKELVARAIHSASRRSDRPLITINCAALPATLIESELFGHEKGAFTGAVARKLGRFELADTGTIFLDEVGELPPESQVKLLRVIEEGEVQRLGGSRPVKVDVRIIAATNRNLKREIERGAFREDLWYRLNVFPITVPPLRQRKEDIPLLVEHFVANYANKFGKTITSITPQTMQKLEQHSWPGNVRELANVIERAVIYTQGSVLNVVDIFDQPEEAASDSSAMKSLEEVEREYILHILGLTSWRIEGPHGAAKLLGLNPSTLRTRMIKLGISKPAFSAHH